MDAADPGSHADRPRLQRQRPTIDSGVLTTVLVIAFLVVLFAIPVVAIILFSGEWHGLQIGPP